jgi:predicted component of type VI protein secretion system
MALVVAVARVDTGESAGEHTFGKEARARGVTFGSSDACDVVVDGLKPEQARLEKRTEGYFFVDLSGDGFTVDDIWHEGGAEYRVGDGSSILCGPIRFNFRRGQQPQRAFAPSTAESVTTQTGTHTTLPLLALSALRELSSRFVGEANFQSAAEIRRFGKQLELTLEVAMEWMGKALRGRAEFQDQFSAPVTQIFSRSLNPVKRKSDITAIANFLLDWREDRDIEGIRESLREAFKDVVNHQIGLLAGVQQFVGDLQQRLDPSRIEDEAGKGKKAWQRYTQVYADTFAESSKLFNELIYPSIRKGYIFSHDDVSDASREVADR